MVRRLPPALRRRGAALRLGQDWVALLACPRCGRSLHHRRAMVRCGKGHAFPVVAGVPVFTEAGSAVEVRAIEHRSHQASGPLVDLFSTTGPPWLHLGAGASDPVLANSVELETAVFVNTHVVGDVHHLPFADATLGGVLALNVFEHLADPDRAASELLRVLVPDAVVVIQTAFLQPLHADPFHFYNTTESGLRRWFRHFDVDEVTVPFNFHPVFALSWQASELLWHADAADRPALGAASLGQLARFWSEPSTREGELWDTLHRLGDGGQRVLAAGFELRAHRPRAVQGSATDDR